MYLIAMNILTPFLGITVDQQLAIRTDSANTVKHKFPISPTEKYDLPPVKTVRFMKSNDISAALEERHHARTGHNKRKNSTAGEHIHERVSVPMNIDCVVCCVSHKTPKAHVIL